MKQTSVGINQGADDVRFVTDRMKQLNHDKQQFALAGAIDLERLTAMGHSAGAEFAARACQQDSRIHACVDLDGAMVPVAALPLYGDDRKILQPLLFLEAFHPENNMGGTPDQITEYKKVKEKQLQELRSGSYDVVLHSPGIAHPSFSDVPLLFHGQDGLPETPIVLHNLDLITQFVRAFLNKTLLGESSRCSTAVSLLFPKRSSRRMATDSDGCRLQGQCAHRQDCGRMVGKTGE
jgi:pimeloyl-ACP methyl ester carboxylesterase